MAKGRIALTADATLDAGENTHTFYPYPARTGYPVIFLHGAGLPDMFSANPAWPNTAKLARVLRRAGIACAQIYGNGTNMANDTAMARITTALSTLSTRTGCSSTKAHLFGISMGGAWAIRYAALNPTKVATVQSVVPATSLINLYAKNPSQPVAGGFSSMVATAWGLNWRVASDVSISTGSPNISSAAGFTAADVNRVCVINTAAVASYGAPKIPYGTTILSQSGTTAVMSANATATATNQNVGFGDPLPTSGSPNADLVSLAPAISTATIPGRLFYSTADLYIDPVDVEALRAAAGFTKFAIDATYGHSDGTMGALGSYNGGTDFSDVLAWLLARGA